MRNVLLHALFLLLSFFPSLGLAQACNAFAGTMNLVDDGDGTNPGVVCFGDGIILNHNMDFVLPPAPAGNTAGVMLGIFNCPPTDPLLTNDPCWTGFYWTGNSYAEINDGTVQTTVGVNTFWFAPVASDAVDAPNHDADNDGCVDVGLTEAYEFTFLDEIQTNQVAIDDCAGEVIIEIVGGYPAIFGGTYNLNNTGGGVINQSGPVGNIVTITNLGNGDPYSFQIVDDGNGCTHSFTGGIMTLDQEDASFTVMDFCEDDPNSATGIVTPGGTFAFNPIPVDGATINPFTGEISGGVAGATYFIEYTTGGSCPGTSTPQPVTVLIVPPPPIVNPTNIDLCPGDDYAIFPVGSTPDPFNFYDDPGLTNLLWTGAFFDVSPFLTPGATLTYYITETNGPCEGGPTEITINVLQLEPPVIDPPEVTICEGESVTITPTSNNPGSTNTFRFFSDPGLNNLQGVGSSYTFTPTGSTAIYITETINACSSDPTQILVIVETPPLAPTISGTLEFCTGEAILPVLANGSGGTLEWYDTDPSLGNPVPIFTGNPFIPPVNNNVAGVTNFWLVESNGGCPSPPTAFSITIDGTPLPPFIQNPNPICVGDPAPQLNATSSGGTINWYNSDPNIGNPAIIFTGNSFTPVINTNISGTYNFWLVEANANACVSEASTVAFIINDLPLSPQVAGTLTICIGEPLPVLSAIGSGGTFEWYDTDPNIGNPLPISTNNPFTPSVDNTMAGNYNFWLVEVSSENCRSVPTDFTFWVDAGPIEPQISDPDPICTGEAIPALIATGSGGTLNWYDQDPNIGNPPIVSTGDNFTPNLDNSIAGTFTFWIQETLNNCLSPAVSVVIEIEDSPNAPSGNAPPAICVGDPIPSLSVNGGGGTILWYGEDPGQGNPALIGSGPTFTPSIDNSATGVFNFWATERSASDCEGPAIQLVIEILENPVPPNLSAPQEICIDESIPELTASNTGGTVSWFDSDPDIGNPISIGSGTSFTPNINNAVPGSYTFWAIETLAGGCVSTSNSTTVTIIEAPNAPGLNSPDPICLGGSIPELTATGSGGTINWYDVDPSGGSATPISTGSTLTPSIDPNTPGINTFWVVEVNSSGCSSVASTTTITINDLPLTPLVIDPPSTCIGEAIPDISVNNNGGVVTWYDADPTGGAAIVLGTGTPFSPNIDNSTPGAYTFWVTETDNANCESTAEEVTLNIIDEPDAPLADSPNPICVGEAIPRLTAIGSGGDINWYLDDPTPGGVPMQFTGDSYDPPIDNGAPGISQFWITETNASGCEGPPTVIEVEVLEVAVAPTISDPDPICIGGEIPELTITNPVGTINWYDADPMSGLANLLGTGSPFTPTVNNTVAGNTTIWVTAEINPGCESEASFIIMVVETPLEAPVIDELSDICLNDAVPVLNATGQGGLLQWYDTNPSVGSPIPIATGPSYVPNIDNTVEGSHTFWVTEQSDSGCEGEAAMVTLVVNGLPMLDFTADCAPNLLTYSVEVNTDGDQLNASSGIVSDNGNGTFTISAIDILVGVDIRVTNSNTGCSFTQRIEPPECNCPVVNAPLSLGNQQICEGEELPVLEVSLELGQTADWYDAPTGGNLLQQGSTTYLPAQAGDYFVQSRDITNNCISERILVRLDINPIPSLLSFDTVCAPGLDQYTVELSFTVADSISTNAGAISNNGNGIFSVSEIPRGTDLEILAINTTTQCNETFVISSPMCPCPIIQPPLSAGDRTICSNEDIPNLEVVVGSGETADWYDAPSGGNLILENSIAYTPNQADTFYVESRNLINSCISDNRTRVILTIRPLPQITASTIFCADDLLTYTVDLTFSNTDNISIDNGMLIDNGGGSYTISAIDTSQNLTIMASNAFCSETFEVFAPNCECPGGLPAPTSLGDQGVCEGEALPILEAVVDVGQTIDWYDAPVGGSLLEMGSTTFQPTQAGTYYVEARDLNNECVSNTRTAIQLSVFTKPNLSVLNQEDPGCNLNNGRLEMSAFGGTMPFRYSLDGVTFQVSNEFNNLGADTYVVIVQDDNFCSDTLEVVIQAPEAVVADAGSAIEPLTCVVDSIQLNGSNSTGPGELSFEWRFNGEMISSAPLLWAMEPGPYELRVQLDACIDRDTVVVEENITDVVAEIENDKELNCLESVLTLDGRMSSQSPSIIYQWQFEGQQISGAVSDTLEVSLPGSYSLIVTDIINGCSANDTLVVEQNLATPIVDAGPDRQLDCQIVTAALDGSGSQEGESLVYQWLDSNGLVIPGANALVWVTDSPGIFTLVVIDTLNGCENRDDVMVEGNFDFPIANAGSSKQLDCTTFEISLDGSNSSQGGTFIYDWMTLGEGNFISATDIVDPFVDAPGQYVLTVTNLENACTSTDTVEVTEIDGITAEFDVLISPPTCFGDNNGVITIFPGLGGEGLRSAIDGGALSNVNQFGGLEPGGHTLDIVDELGCSWDTTFILPEGLQLDVSLGEDQFIDLGDSTTLNALVNVSKNEIDTVLWTNAEFLNCGDCLDPQTTRLLNSTAFGIRVIDRNGCSDEDMVQVIVDRTKQIFVPNVFSPDGNGINDRVFIQTDDDVIEIKDFKIFDRWGEIVFEVKDVPPNDPSYGWDGRFGNSRSPEEYNSGVFIYFAEVAFLDGTVELFSGDIILMR